MENPLSNLAKSLKPFEAGKACGVLRCGIVHDRTMAALADRFGPEVWRIAGNAALAARQEMRDHGIDLDPEDVPPPADPKEQELPLLRGELTHADGDVVGTLKVWCPFCRRHHFHGWEVGNETPRHRNAHCSIGGGSPFRSRGYLIAPFPVDVDDESGEDCPF